MRDVTEKRSSSGNPLPQEEAAEKARIYIRCYKADLLAAYRLNENKKEQNLSVFSLIYGII